jgi:hypothetical protein
MFLWTDFVGGFFSAFINLVLFWIFIIVKNSAFVGVFTNKLPSELLVKTPTKAKKQIYIKI